MVAFGVFCTGTEFQVYVNGPTPPTTFEFAEGELKIPARIYSSEGGTIKILKNVGQNKFKDVEITYKLS